MENKKTVEEIRNEIKSLEEQEFELQHGLTKVQYSELVRKIHKDIEKFNEDKKRREKMYDSLFHFETKPSTELTLSHLKSDVKGLKEKVSKLESANAIKTILIGALVGAVVFMFIL